MRRDDWLLQQLPVGMLEDDFLVRFLTIFQTVADTAMKQIDTLPHMFDPTVAPASMVRTMASWIGLDWVDSSLDERVQRDIVLNYSKILSWRGTRPGLVLLLEVLSGGAAVSVSDSGGVFEEGTAPTDQPHVSIRLGSGGWNSTGDLLRIIRGELPAGVTFDLTVAGEPVWPVKGHTAVDGANVGERGSVDADHQLP